MPRYDLVAMARRPTPASAAASSYATSCRRLSWRPNLSRATCARVIAAWADALPRINTAYERTLSELTTDSPADVRAEIDGVAEAINRLVMILAPEVRCWALSVERWHRGKRRARSSPRPAWTLKPCLALKMCALPWRRRSNRTSPSSRM